MRSEYAANQALAASRQTIKRPVVIRRRKRFFGIFTYWVVKTIYC